MNISRALQKLVRLPAKAIPGGPQKREKEPEIIKRKEEPKTLFRGRPYINRPWFRRALKKASFRVKGVGVIPEKKRLAIEKELYPQKKYGAFLTPGEYHQTIRELKRKRHYAKSWKERREIYETIKFLEQLEGKNEK
jgi:hypothetical protein